MDTGAASRAGPAGLRARGARLSEWSLDNPFVFDDRETVLLNPSLITAWDWRAALLHNLARPVVNLSYAIDRAAWGFSSFGFHVTNVILHIVAVGLFYGWCTRALADGVRPGSDRGQTRVGPGSDPGLTPEWPAFFAAAVFALHPVMSAAVGYVSARSGAAGRRRLPRRADVRATRDRWPDRNAGILAGIFGALAIGSSSSAAALPVVVLAYDAWVLRDPGWRGASRADLRPATLVVVSFGAWQVTGAGIESPASRHAVPSRICWPEASVVWRYLALLVVPRGQALVHDVRWATRSWTRSAVVARDVARGGRRRRDLEEADAPAGRVRRRSGSSAYWRRPRRSFPCVTRWRSIGCISRPRGCCSPRGR